MNQFQQTLSTAFDAIMADIDAVGPVPCTSRALMVLLGTDEARGMPADGLWPHALTVGTVRMDEIVRRAPGGPVAACSGHA